MEKDLLHYFLPEKLLEHFTITDFLELGDIISKKTIFHIHLEENNNLPPGFDPNHYESKGFFPSKTIKVTRYVPGNAYTYVKDGISINFPSPMFHS